MLNKGIRLIGVLALVTSFLSCGGGYSARLQSRTQGREPEGLGHGSGGL